MITDRQFRQFTDVKPVVVREVNLNTNTVLVEDYHGGYFQVSMHFGGPIVSIPAPNEVWTIRRHGYDWYLDQQGAPSIDSEIVQPGDKIIQGRKIHLSA